MSTPAQWAELVTTALLGTDRRPLEVADPPVAVLREAARHRVLDRLAAPEVAEQGPAGPAPGPDGPQAPDAADRLLTELLRIPDPALISCWLQVCAKHGGRVAAIHWTPLARLAARTTAYDRAALGAALGARGRWFLRQNPEWRRLAADAERRPEPPPPAGETAAHRPPLGAEEVLVDPELLLRRPQPWEPELVAAAYAVLGGAGAAPPPRSFASRLGVRLPPEHYPSIASAVEFYLLAPDLSPAQRRTIRERFVALEHAAYARAAIDHAFTHHDTDGSFTRAEIPHV